MAKKKELPTTEEAFIAYQKSFIIASLRRASLYWPYRNIALRNARVARGMYKCAQCGNVQHKKLVRVDHIEPVVKLSGLTDWNVYFARMFVKAEQFQILCIECHSQKTKEESILRAIQRKMKKTQKKA